ncbi:hypothetical protein [Wenjunlia tyrosinilytica]|uniref:Uncharacterized protein n=1 Tax=Wenjunlia tyrosinilytica TaxID=1544741 RepID=A0A918DXH8_9ACTN|nr:hypothetical protein [Wenjunlia tyrosinilytica]GGO86591.1 hypothetical protein GCM10012280_23080 [Wenjunlia tyrosinilytica]
MPGEVEGEGAATVGDEILHGLDEPFLASLAGPMEHQCAPWRAALNCFASYFSSVRFRGKAAEPLAVAFEEEPPSHPHPP